MNVKASGNDGIWITFLKELSGNSLVLQWLGFRPFTVGGLSGSLPWGLRSLKPCDRAKFKTDHSVPSIFIGPQAAAQKCSILLS